METSLLEQKIQLVGDKILVLVDLLLTFFVFCKIIQFFMLIFYFTYH